MELRDKAIQAGFVDLVVEAASDLQEDKDLISWVLANFVRPNACGVPMAEVRKILHTFNKLLDGDDNRRVNIQMFMFLICWCCQSFNPLTTNENNLGCRFVSDIADMVVKGLIVILSHDDRQGCTGFSFFIFFKVWNYVFYTK